MWPFYLKKNSNWFACPIYFTSGLLLTNYVFLFDDGPVWNKPSDSQFCRFLSECAMHKGRELERKLGGKPVKTKGFDKEHGERGFGSTSAESKKREISMMLWFNIFRKKRY